MFVVLLGFGCLSLCTCRHRLQTTVKRIIIIVIMFPLRNNHKWARASSFFEVFIPHNATPQSVELLSTRDRPFANTSTLQHTTLSTDIHAPGGIRSRNPSKRLVADPRLRPLGHRDGHS